MNRNRRLTVTIVTLAALALATAAYAPHSETLAKMAETNAPITPCGAPQTFATSTDIASTQTAKYPVPSDDVIAQGHSGSAH